MKPLFLFVGTNLQRFVRLGPAGLLALLWISTPGIAGQAQATRDALIGKGAMIPRTFVVMVSIIGTIARRTLLRLHVDPAAFQSNKPQV
jgi:hypothetical protein